MAIALVSTTNITVPNTTAVNAGSGANRLIMCVTCGDITDNMSAVTWNGESLTKGLTQNFSAIGRFNYIWYLHNPSGTGSQNLVITGAGGGGSISTCLVYSDVSGIPTDFIQSTVNGTSIANNHTAVTGDWLVGGGGNDVSTLSFGTNTTVRSGASSQGQADSNGVSSPTALNYTCTGGNMATYGAVISPSVAAPATAGFLFLMV